MMLTVALAGPGRGGNCSHTWAIYVAAPRGPAASPAIASLIVGVGCGGASGSTGMDPELRDGSAECKAKRFDVT